MNFPTLSIDLKYKSEREKSMERIPVKVLGYSMIPGKAAAHILSVQKARNEYKCDGICSQTNDADLKQGGPMDSTLWREPATCDGTIYKGDVYVRQSVRSEGVIRETFRCCRACALHYDVIAYG